ncbi:Protein of unknown function [Lactobacillus helveticus CIRM-BIA 101]|uniref:Uncharacterized protein n=3 Tax=Lactobacillus helveticus TaxID=1587 RepID=U4QBY7_LACHE|nr:Protein of unknown function [Lactobacillus helveticus CIRM-BIA 953]CDI57496.1 Protein of unknown function [Lactobacillus helveticus CIRM-BIA 951]CDI60726.1 Protein of unknown function [Lactobacillus helveticus CIRM-BIA 104]CDI62614.1 Protein of unknown function [Lactobacillus helveticus CIRM-BIA 103]CDI66229.1 Protein of unknown function [Lactobacillus helveticus CIRM-BIA 101]
MLVPQLLIFQQ